MEPGVFTCALANSLPDLLKYYHLNLEAKDEQYYAHLLMIEAYSVEIICISHGFGGNRQTSLLYFLTKTYVETVKVKSLSQVS
jgi:hypothetical protein